MPEDEQPASRICSYDYVEDSAASTASTEYGVCQGLWQKSTSTASQVLQVLRTTSTCHCALCYGAVNALPLPFRLAVGFSYPCHPSTFPFEPRRDCTPTCTRAHLVRTLQVLVAQCLYSVLSTHKFHSQRESRTVDAVALALTFYFIFIHAPCPELHFEHECHSHFTHLSTTDSSPPSLPISPRSIFFTNIWNTLPI